ncbi:hypothetical protein KY284_022656 [Solanum tuberosum]|nr:hypothetical protein KY284_022656 [Solanum tuberosum]
MQKSGSFTLDHDDSTPFSIMKQSMFVLLGFSTTSVVFDPKQDLSDSGSGSNVCKGMYSCKGVIGIGLEPNDPISTCCVYDPPVPIGSALSFPKNQLLARVTASGGPWLWLRQVSKFNKRNYDGGVIEFEGGLTIFCELGKSLKGSTLDKLDSNDMEDAHFYILKNCDEIQPFLEEFSQIYSETSQQSSDVEWNRKFISWLQKKVAELYKHDDSKRMEDLLSLSRGLCHMSQDSKAILLMDIVGETGEEQNHMDYYSELTEVLELQFVGGRRVILFRCMWFDVYDQMRGVKTDEHGFVSVNRRRYLKINEPFVLASEASQVDMNPSITLKYEMGQASKIPKHELIQPGALAKGLGQSLKSMSTIRVNAERRTPIAKNRSYYTSTSKLNKIADNSFHVHPCFEEKEDNAPLYQEAEMNQYTLTSDARGQGQSLRINAEKRTMIGENRNTTTTSSQNKPAKKSIPVPPDFNPMEDNDTLFLETEVTRDTQRSDHLQKSPFESRKAKEVVGVAQGSKGNQNRKYVLVVTYKAANKLSMTRFPRT